MSKSSRDLRESLRIAKKRHREAEDSVLLEARRQRDLDSIYAAASTVRSTALPRTFNQDRGR